MGVNNYDGIYCFTLEWAVAFTIMSSVAISMTILMYRDYLRAKKMYEDRMKADAEWREQKRLEEIERAKQEEAEREARAKELQVLIEQMVERSLKEEERRRIQESYKEQKLKAKMEVINKRWQ